MGGASSQTEAEEGEQEISGRDVNKVWSEKNLGFIAVASAVDSWDVRGRQ